VKHIPLAAVPTQHARAAGTNPVLDAQKSRLRVAPAALSQNHFDDREDPDQWNRPEPSIRRSKPLCLSLLFLLLIVFVVFRLRTLGLSARDLLFLLNWLVSRFLLRTGLLRIAVLRIARFLI
jgi:hypothetical protein